MRGTAHVIFSLNATPTPTPTPVSFHHSPQVIGSLGDQTVELNQPFSFQIASDTFIDPDGDALTYTAAQSGSTVLPSWLQFNTVTRFFSGAPNQSTTPINVTASDPYGLSASTIFNIDVQNALPVSSNDNASGINGGLIGGIVGATVGVAVSASLAYKQGFFTYLSQQLKNDRDISMVPRNTI